MKNTIIMSFGATTDAANLLLYHNIVIRLMMMHINKVSIIRPGTRPAIDTELPVSLAKKINLEPHM